MSARIRTRPGPLVATVATCAVVLAFAARPAAAQLTCATYATLADAVLPPSAGSPALVTAMVSGAAGWTGNGPSRRFNLRTAQRAIGERLRRTGPCATNAQRKRDPARFACEYANEEGTAFLRVAMSDGRIIYLNPGRRFDPSGPDNGVGSDAALAAGRSLLEALGVPPGEIDGSTARAAPRMLASRPTDLSVPPRVRRMEVLAAFTRTVNGFPVLDSRANVAIDTEGKPARAHVAWPDFTLAPGLGDAAAMPRAAVIAAIVEALGALDRGCEAFAALRVQPGWVPAQVADRSDEAGAQAPSGRYVPGLRVMALPPETAEDAGVVSDFVHVFTVPLVGSASEG